MSGFDFFDVIQFTSPVQRPRIAARVQARLARLGIADRVEQLPAVATPGDERIGVVLSHRRAVQAACDREARCVLVLSGDVHFLDRTHDVLARATAELAQRPWSLCHLGGWWPVVPLPEPGCQHLDPALNVSNTHAVAYNRDVYSRLLADWPDDLTGVEDWLERNLDLDRYLARIGPSFVVRPVVTTMPDLLPFEDAAVQTRFNG